ncbi:HalOD1 output domain-containing protein [Salinirubrum litoreum]|uniref:HalOD1 output domain-containing protein n=1 Tax=Salinirubrum litoreum TaxID=1126234 RepID=A0ABD5RB70_9EURY|nr:HalOD1 output domain-containing protein [Salinirubrum litoreum]
MSDIDETGTTSHDDPNLDGDVRWQQVAQRLYESDHDGELTTVIVYAIADAMDVDPKEVTAPPLYEVVDVPGIEKAFFG